MAARPRSRRLARSRRTLPDVPGQNQPGPMIRAVHRAISHPRPMPARCQYLRARHPDRGPGPLDLPAARRPRRSHLAEREFPDPLGIPRFGFTLTVITSPSTRSPRADQPGAGSKAPSRRRSVASPGNTSATIATCELATGYSSRSRAAGRPVRATHHRPGPTLFPARLNLRFGSGRFSVRSERRSAHKAAQMRQSSPDVAF